MSPKSRLSVESWKDSTRYCVSFQDPPQLQIYGCAIGDGLRLLDSSRHKIHYQVIFAQPRQSSTLLTRMIVMPLAPGKVKPSRSYQGLPKMTHRQFSCSRGPSCQLRSLHKVTMPVVW
jgi:hypothetical protein